MYKFAFSSLTIRTQLLLLAVLLTLPALGIILYTGLKERSNDYRQAAIESQKLADHLTAKQENLVYEAQQLGSFLAELPDVANRNSDKVQPIISNTLKKNPQFKNIILTDENGLVWAASNPFPPLLSLAERRYFKSARDTLRFSSGQFIIGSISKQPVFAMAYPLVDHGIFRGVVVIGFDLDIMKSILRRSQLPPDSNYILVDHNGIIISRGIERGRNVGESMQIPDLKRMIAGPDRDTYEFVLGKDDRRITTYRKLRLPGEETPYMYVRDATQYRHHDSLCRDSAVSGTLDRQTHHRGSSKKTTGGCAGHSQRRYAGTCG